MSARPEDLLPPPRRLTRRRLFLYSALGLITLLILAILIGLLFLRSDRFNRILSVEIEKALESYGLRAEIGKVEAGSGLRSFTLHDLKIFNRQSDQLIATINRATVSLTIRDPFALKLSREIAFDRLELDGLDLWVIINERGESNFQGLRRPPPLRRRITIDYSSLTGSLSRGALHLIDRKRDLQSDLRDLTGDARPIKNSDPPGIDVRLASVGGGIRRNDRETPIDSFELIGRVMESGGEIERLALRSPAFEVNASGRLDDWQAPIYQLDLKARAQIGEVLAFSAPELELKGDADFNGLIEGETTGWSASGSLRSEQLSLGGVTFHGVQADRVRLDPQTSRQNGWIFSIGQAQVRSINSEGIEITSAAAENVKGTFADGEAQATAEQASVARIKSGRNEFKEVKLRAIRASFGSDKRKKSRNPQWKFSSDRAHARSGVARGIEFTNASASKVSGTIVDGQMRITSDQATVARIRIKDGAGHSEFNGVKSRDIEATFGQDSTKGVKNDRLTFSSKITEARSIIAGDVALTGVYASNLKGSVIDGRAEINSDRATVDRAVSGQNEINEIVAQDLAAIFESGAGQRAARQIFSIGQIRTRSAIAVGTVISATSASKVNLTIAGDRAQLTLGQAIVDRAETGRGAFNEIRLDDVRAAFNLNAPDAGEAEGRISLRDGTWDNLKFGDINGRFVANRSEISLRSFKGDALGGGVTGDLVIGLAPDATSTLRVDFTGAQTAQLFSLFGARSDQFEGTVSGRANVTWPGSNLRLMSGEFTARLEGQTTSTPDGIPIRGDITARAQSGVFYLEAFTLRTDASTLTATGKLALDGDSDLRFSVTSTRAEELQSILMSGLVGGEVERLLKTYEPQFFGDFSFTGTINGRLDNPTIAGDAQAATFGLRDEILGALRGRILISPLEIRFEQGSLTSDTGSAKFNYISPRDATSTEGRLDLTFERFHLDTLLAAIGLPTQQSLVSGDVSGEAHLTGLPGSPKGEVKLNLVNGMIAGQSAESALAIIKFDGDSARLEKVEARLSQGRFSASGVIDLKSNKYQIRGQAEQLGLQRIAEAFNLDAARLTGVADANFQISGDFNNAQEFRIELTAKTREVTINGKEAGPITLTARTRPDGRIDVEMATEIAGRRQPITLSIEWRLAGRPAEIRADLADFDIAPFFSVFAPEIAQSIAGRVTGTLRVAGPTLNAQGEATLAGLRGSLFLTSVSLEVEGTPVNVSTPLEVTIGGSQLRIDSARITGQGTDLTISGAFALTENAQINFSIAGRVNLGAFNRPNDDLNFDGEIEIDARIGGSLSEPNISGSATLREISVSSGASPIAIDGGSGRIVLSGDRLTIENFSARAGGGSTRINGGVTLERLRPVEWKFEISAEGAEVLWQSVRATADATLTLTGTPQSQKLSGRVTIPTAEYTSDFSLSDLGERGALKLGGFGLGGITSRSTGAFPPVTLDVTVEARESFMIRSNQVNTVASAVLNLTGTMTDPEISGRVMFEGGQVIFRGERYNITVGSLELPGGFAEPRLQLQAESDIRGYRVRIGFSGPINSLELSLSSEPSLPRDEIISLITTGATQAGMLSGADPTRSGLTAAGSLLSQEFISGPLGRETDRFLGLNRFQIDPILRPFRNPAARLTIGRQLARGLTFIYSTNLSSEQDQIATVEYNISNRFSIMGTYLQSGDTQLQGLEQNDFIIEVRGRKTFSLGVSSLPSPNAGVTLRSQTRPPLPLGNLRLGIAPGPEEVHISRSRLREVLPVMREGMGRSQIRLGERNLTNYLQEKGYLFPEVQGRCEPADCKAPSVNQLHVVYDIRPGARYEVKDIHIIGADELNEKEVVHELRSRKRNQFGEFFGRFPLFGGFVRGVTSNDRLRDDSETIRDRLAELGYRSARVEPRLSISPDCDDVIVTFYVNKGLRSTVSDVVVRGNATVEAALLSVFSPIKPGDFFSSTEANLGARQIREFYNERGYLDARAVVRVEELSDNCVRLIYEVNEGARAYACCISITGQTITREGSIRRFLDFDDGDMLTPKLLRDAERDLYTTGAFREVVVRASPIPGADETTRSVSVRVAEAAPLTLFYGLGFSTDNGPRAEIQLTNNNLFGRLVSGSVKLRGSGDDQLAQLQFTDWRPWGKKWPTTFSTFYNRDADLRPFRRRRLIDNDVEPGSTGQSFGVNRFVSFVQTQRKLSEQSVMRFRYIFENSKLFDLENIPEIEVTRNERAIRLGMISAGFTHDSRDNALQPTRGVLYSGDYFLAARVLGGNESFNKFFANHQRYYKLPRLGDSIFAFSARLGLGQLFRITDRDNDGFISEPERRLPISERFFAGGATTLRGFRFEEAGPQGILEPRNSNELPTLVPIGGDALVILNFELRFPLSRRWSLVTFYDWGNVFRKIPDINFAGMTSSVGLGLRFNTPIGPIGVDYGYLIDPPFFITASGATLRQPRGAFHIRVGQTF